MAGTCFRVPSNHVIGSCRDGDFPVSEFVRRGFSCGHVTPAKFGRGLRGGGAMGATEPQVGARVTIKTCARAREGAAFTPADFFLSPDHHPRRVARRSVGETLQGVVFMVDAEMLVLEHYNSSSVDSKVRRRGGRARDGAMRRLSPSRALVSPDPRPVCKFAAPSLASAAQAAYHVVNRSAVREVEVVAPAPTVAEDATLRDLPAVNAEIVRMREERTLARAKAEKGRINEKVSRCLAACLRRPRSQPASVGPHGSTQTPRTL